MRSRTDRRTRFINAVRIDVFTIFPGACRALLRRLTSRAGRVVREPSTSGCTTSARLRQDPHRSVDDAPFGGGPGMVLAAGPVFGAVESVDPPAADLPALARRASPRPVGGPGASALEGFSLVCGRYEGVDQRVVDHLVDGELSVATWSSPGGEAAAIVVVEAVVRLLPGVMGNEASSRGGELLRGASRVPAVHDGLPSFRGWEVPPVLLSGDHGRISRWRKAMALKPHPRAAARPHRGTRGPHRRREGADRRLAAGRGGLSARVGPIRPRAPGVRG